MLNHADMNQSKSVPIQSDELGGVYARRFHTNQYLQHAQLHPDCLFLIRRGWVIKYRQMRDGRRQVTGLFLSGDCCDLTWLAGHSQTHSFKAITEVETIAIPRTGLVRHLGVCPDRTAALLNEVALQSSMSAEQCLALGRKTAAERLAHLFAEMWWRLEWANGTPMCHWPMPLTQQDLADMTGLTPVHVNRVLKELRDSGIVTIRARRIVVADVGRLQRLAQFDPRYLQGLSAPRLGHVLGC